MEKFFSEDGPITTDELLIAAELTCQLEDFLDRCIMDENFPLLIGFDLPFLAKKFEEAADHA